MITIEQAVREIQQRFGGGGYNARYDHTDSKGNYVIQVSAYNYEVGHSVTYDWFVVNPRTTYYEGMFTGHSGYLINPDGSVG